MEFVQRRSRILVFWLFSGLFAALTAPLCWGQWTGKPLTSLWLLVALVTFSTTGLILSTGLLIRPARLTVTEAGVFERMLWRRRLHRWEDIARFRVWRLNSNRWVAFDDLRPTGHRDLFRSINRASGAEGTFRVEFGSRAQEIAEALEEARRRWWLEHAVDAIPISLGPRRHSAVPLSPAPPRTPG